MKNVLWIFCLAAIGLTSCLVSTENLPDQEALRTAIAQSISVPFDTHDTLIYRSRFGFCGNTSRYELNKIYQPCLNERPYFGMLKKQYPGMVLATGDSLYRAITDTFRTSHPGCETQWDCFSKNKVHLSILGEALTNSSVSISETYSYNGHYVSFQKLFSYYDGKWTYTTLADK